jgi:hypothetical protein
VQLTSDCIGVEMGGHTLDSYGNSVDRCFAVVTGHDRKLKNGLQERWVIVQKSEVTVGEVKCIQVKAEIHLSRKVIVALLRTVLQSETGSLEEHKRRGPE